jgi:hypothetical protein
MTTRGISEDALLAQEAAIAAAPADEPRILIDDISAAAPGLTPALLAVRP